MFAAPATFGPYELLERIGMGGMAEVFLARQRGEEGFERLVAIKRILSQVSEDEDFVRMFVDEAKIAVQLSHPNIAQIYDLGREGESYFIAQEYVHGRDMGAVGERQAAAGTPLPIPFVLFVATKVCEALAHAHEAHGAGGRPLNLIHRDVSPSNVLVSFEGAVKVIDFGLAKAAGRLVTTQAGVVKGKLAYLSSEQARGLHIDSRSDLFSLGVCMFEWLTGQRLFARRNDIETVLAVQKAEVPPLRAIRGDVPPVLQQIVLHALAPDPDRRFQSAQEMHDALLSFTYDTRSVMKRRAVGEYVRTLFPDVRLDEPFPRDDGPRDTRPVRPVEQPSRRDEPVFAEEATRFDDETFALDDASELLFDARALVESDESSAIEASDFVSIDELADQDEDLAAAVEDDEWVAVVDPGLSHEAARAFTDVGDQRAVVRAPTAESSRPEIATSGSSPDDLEPFEDTTSPGQRLERPVSFEDATSPNRDEASFEETTSPLNGPRLDSLLAQAVATSPVIRTPERLASMRQEPRGEETPDELEEETLAVPRSLLMESVPGADPFDLDFDDVTRVGDAFEDDVER